MEDVEHPAGNQLPSVGENSHAAKECAGPSGTANQHSLEQ
jgi:hypothetical protein